METSQDPTHDEAPPFDFADPNSPLAPYYLLPSQVVGVGVFVALLLFFSLGFRLHHTDIWAHLKYGEWIVENRDLPTSEPFGRFSDPNAPMRHFQWLGQSLLYLTYQAGESISRGDELQRIASGVEMLRSLHGLLVVAKLLILFFAYRRMTQSSAFGFLGIALMLFFGLTTMTVMRPQLFGELCFAGLLYLLVSAPYDGRKMLMIAVIFALWANLHASYFVGFALLGVLFLARLTEKWRGSDLVEGDTLPLPGWTFGTLLLSFFATWIHPHGPRLFRYVLELSNNNAVKAMEEWQPLNFSEAAGGHWGWLAIFAIVTFTQLLADKSFSLRRYFVVLFFALIPLLAQQRLMIWWLMLFPWAVLPAWHQLWSRWNAGEKPVSDDSTSQTRSVPNFRNTVYAGLLVAVGLTWTGAVQLVFGGTPIDLDRSVSRGALVPVAHQLQMGNALPKLEEALKSYPNGKFRGMVFAQENMSDYFIWRLGREAPVLAFSHVHVIQELDWENYIRLLFARPGWRFVLDRYGINLVVLDLNIREDLAEKIREDQQWIVLVDENQPRFLDTQARLFLALRKSPKESS